MGSVKKGKIKVDEAVKKLKFLPFEDLGFAKVDHHRTLRKGFPEVVYCQNKSKKQVVEIINSLAKSPIVKREIYCLLNIIIITEREYVFIFGIILY